MGEEIGQGFTISDFQVEDQTNLTLKDISKGSHLKNDVTFTLLILIYPHMVVMVNEIDNLLGLAAILNGEPIGLRNHASRQCCINIGESNSRGNNRS
jgi:hypothetical protein